MPYSANQKPCSRGESEWLTGHPTTPAILAWPEMLMTRSHPDRAVLRERAEAAARESRNNRLRYSRTILRRVLRGGNNRRSRARPRLPEPDIRPGTYR